MKTAALILILVSGSFLGCTHQFMRGSVAMKVSDQEGYVCMGKDEVKVGDKVALFKNECQRGASPEPYSGDHCKKVKLGAGTITRVVSDHYSIVETEGRVPFEEGTIVEKY